MDVKYDQISHLVHSENYEPPMYKVQFKDSNQDEPLEGTAAVEPGTADVAKNAGKQAVKRGVFSAAIRSVSRLFGSAVGGGTGGYIASSAASSAGHAAANENMKSGREAKVNMTDDMKKEKVVEAFGNVKNAYEFNEADNKWKFKTA